MDRGVLFYFTISFIGLTLAYREKKEENPRDTYYDEDYDYTYDDVESDKEYTEKLNKPKINNDVTTRKAATYEVTENVDDIPNTSLRIGPVIVDYTIAVPINNGSVSNTVVKNNTGFPAIVNNINNELNNNGITQESSNNNDKEASIKAKKNYFSIFHIKAEYDDKPNTPSNSDSHNTVHKQSGFKDYILGIKKGIINGLSRIFHKQHGYEDNTHEHRPEAGHEHISHKLENTASRFEHVFRNLDDENE